MVGLGNPGPEYAETRHNVGFRVVEILSARWRTGPWRELCDCLVSAKVGGDPSAVLAKPQTFMNRSGPALAALLRRSEVELSSVLVIHDDLDLPFGIVRIRLGGGHGGHNGLRSIVSSLGSGEFLRLKIGIGRPPSRKDVVDHVLSPFSPEEAAELLAVLDRAADAVEAIRVEGPLKAMNRFHA